MKNKIKKIKKILVCWAKILVRWTIIGTAIVLFVLFAHLLAGWIQDKIWILYVLDGIFCLVLWLLLNIAMARQYVRISRKKAIKMVIYVFIMTILLFIIVGATLGLFDVLIVRLNIIFLPLLSFGVSYGVLKRKGMF